MFVTIKFFLPCFCCIPQVLACCVSIFVWLKNFFLFPLLSSLIHYLFRRMLFNFHVFLNFVVFVLFISNFIPLWSEKIPGMISIFLNLLGLVLWPYMWSILENVLCTLERMCILTTLHGMFCICQVHLIYSVQLHCSFLDDLSIVKGGVLESPIVIVLLFISPFSSVSFCFIYLGAQC